MRNDWRENLLEARPHTHTRPCPCVAMSVSRLELEAHHRPIREPLEAAVALVEPVLHAAQQVDALRPQRLWPRVHGGRAQYAQLAVHKGGSDRVVELDARAWLGLGLGLR